MEFFFNPKGIAVIGASGTPLRTGNRVLRNVMAGFKGGIYPVNPRYEEMEGLTCYSSVLKVPDPVDLAIVLVPARGVPEVIRDCAKRGIPGAIIESAGFAETGKEGKALQEELEQINRETGIRLWGPNCMGLVDVVHNHIFSFVIEGMRDEGFVPGEVSLIVQSGFLSAGFLVDIMSHGTMAISKACSIGNKIDVDECDLLEYMIGDSDTGAIGLYLESIPNGRRFIDLCRSSQKPIVVLKGGKSAVGAKAAMSHTASLAGDGAIVRDALAQAGVVEAGDFRQMMDLCRALARFPQVPEGSGKRVAVLTPSGGAGIVSADFVDQVGLELADLSESTREALRSVYPEWMPVANPIDIWPGIERNGAEAYKVAFKALCADPNVDAIFFHLFALGVLGEDVSFLAEGARTSGKPIFCWLMGRRQLVDQIQKEAREQDIPVFRELFRTAECMAAVLKRRRVTEAETHEISIQGAITLPQNLDQVLKDTTGSLDEYLSKQVLAACEIPVVEEQIVTSGDEAAEVASRLGFPVVMKGISPGKIHKTELGLVRLGIASAEQATAEFKDLDRVMGGNRSVLVQEHVQGELELIVGLVRDPQFGPCVMLGVGGVMTEILGDSAFAVAPLSAVDARELMNRLKTQELLDGFRGAPGVDRDALSRILIRIGELGCDYSRVREIDINPLIVRNGKPVAVDATVILND
jgi:acetyltransferase